MALPAPVWRWRASSSAVADGATVASLAGEGTVTTALSQTTASKQPVMKRGANGIGGQPALLFDNVDDSLVSAAAIAKGAVATWMVVLRPGTGVYGAPMYFASQEVYWDSGGHGIYGGAAVFVSGEPTRSTNQVWTGVFTGTTGATFRKGGATAATGSAGSAAAASQNIYLGSRAADRTWSGLIAEMIGWDRVLSDAELAQAHSYVQDTYGVTVADYAASGGSSGGGGSSPYASAVLALNPVLYLRLGETSGTTAADASGNGRSGTYSGGYTLGAASGLSDGDKAASFASATSGQVSVAHDAVLNQATGSGTAWSIVFRLRADAAGSFPGIIGKGTTTTGWGVFRDGSTGAIGYKNMGTQVTTTAGVVVGTWAHWVITNDGASIRFYKDGTLVTTAAFATAHATAITTALLVNKADSYGDNTLDEVSLHTTTLTQAQITSLVAAQTATAGASMTLSGAVAATAAVARQAAKVAAGTSSGVAALQRAFARTATATTTPAGTKRGVMAHATIYGAVFTTGAAQRGYPRSVAGGIILAGVVAKKSAGRFAGGTITAAGSVQRAFGRGVGGSTSSTGQIAKGIGRPLSGTTTASGVPHQLGVRFRSFAGSIATAASIRRGPAKRPAGTTGAAGLFRTRAFQKRQASAIATTSALVAGLFRRVFGPSGECVVTLAAAVEVDTDIYLAHRAQMVVATVDTTSP